MPKLSPNLKTLSLALGSLLLTATAHADISYQTNALAMLDGTVDSISVQTPLRNTPITDSISYDGSLSISINIQAENNQEADRLSAAILSDFADAQNQLKQGARSMSIELRGSRSAYGRRYDCLSMQAFGNTNVRGACITSIQVNHPQMARTSVVVDNRLITSAAPQAPVYPIPAPIPQQPLNYPTPGYDLLKQMLNSNNFDSERSSTLDNFIASNPGVSFNLQEAFEIMVKFDFHKNEVANKLMSHVRASEMNQDKQALLAAVEKLDNDMSADDAPKLSAIDLAVSVHQNDRFVLVADVVRLLKAMSFKKIEAVRKLSGHVLDTQNAILVMDSMTFQSEKREAVQLLDK